MYDRYFREMVTKRCSWGTCNSDSRYKHKPHMQNVVFHPFPKPSINLEKCLLWIKQCARPHSQLSVNSIAKHHFVCSKHFPDGAIDPITACPLSTPKVSRKRPADRFTPSVSAKKKAVKSISFQQSPIKFDLSSNPDGGSVLPAFHDLFKGFDNVDPEPIDKPDNVSAINNILVEPATVDEPKHDKNMNYFIQEVVKNDETCFHYTGVPSVVLLQWLNEWIEPAAKQIKLWDGKRKTIPGRKGGRHRKKCSLFQELILCLVKIRNGFSNKHLSFLFGISESHVCRIFIAYVNLLNQCLKDLIVWPAKDVVKANLPSSFLRYPRTRAIIDCTEYHVQRPLRPAAQKATWSNYKHANTLKQLVAISPSGAITFLSDIYPGSITDVAIVKASGFVNVVEEGDDIMADRGFNIRHLLLPKKATLNIPAFTHGRVLSKKAVRRSRPIASVRIHVERAIRRMKTFKILSGTIPLKFRFLLRQITTIVAVLCNLQPCLA